MSRPQRVQNEKLVHIHLRSLKAKDFSDCQILRDLESEGIIVDKDQALLEVMKTGSRVSGISLGGIVKWEKWRMIWWLDYFYDDRLKDRVHDIAASLSEQLIAAEPGL
jgi:hypothetical protein